jgi:nicotinamide-nucleotide amidase
MFVEVVTIGDELCRGEIVDTNSSWLAERLWEQELTVRWMTSCRDDAGDIERALFTAAARADLVLVSGGLGPTEDDLTVDVVARMLGRPAIEDPEASARVHARMAGRGAVTPLHLRQTRVPVGARVFANSEGAAPGFEVAVGATPVVCLPGVPRELRAIFDGELGSHLAARREAVGALRRQYRVFRVFGLGEAQIANALDGLLAESPAATLHYQVRFPETLVKIAIEGVDRGDAARQMDALEEGVRARLGASMYSVGAVDLPRRVAERLASRGRTVACAESCTGGMLSELLTRYPGSSRYFTGAAIVYSNQEKMRQLGVSADTLATHGAVSEACVRELAAGARDRFSVDFSIAISGIAGPDGGTPEKPVGTVWLGLASERGVRARELRWPFARDQVRLMASWAGLWMLHNALGDRAPEPESESEPGEDT